MCKKTLFFPCIVASIAILWISYLGTLGAELFAHLYNDECEAPAFPIVIAAFLLGCASFFAFVVFRAFAGSFSCRFTENERLVSLQSRVSHFAHVVLSLICLITTSLSLARLEQFSCGALIPDEFVPSAYPVVAVALINALNAPMTLEQWSKRGVMRTYDELCGNSNCGAAAGCHSNDHSSVGLDSDPFIAQTARLAARGRRMFADVFNVAVINDTIAHLD